VNFNGSFIFTHQKFHNRLLFDGFQHGSEKVIHWNQTERKPLCKPSLTAWQTEAKGTMNKLGQILLQVHTTWARYLH
jgi:hypothetical protein